MITTDELRTLVKKYKTNETVIVREYLQVWLLSLLYQVRGSEQVFFKGGTALHLLFGASRFSEDLDFTVGSKKGEFGDLLNKVIDLCGREEKVSFKPKKAVAGQKWLLTAEPEVVRYKVFVNLDFSFREKVWQPTKSIIDTEFPVVFRSYVYHLSKEEIFAEKVRALLSRKQGRDLYDLWYLLSIGVGVEDDLIRDKLAFYKINNYEDKLFNRLKEFKRKDFINDLRSFVAINEREKLGDLFDYAVDYLNKKLVLSGC